MARSVEQIQQDLGALDRAIEAIAHDLQHAYRQYLSDLSLAAGKQLMLASYYLCTQGYPKEFLQLSVSERQTLQQSLRQVSQEVQATLMAVLNPLPDQALDDVDGEAAAEATPEAVEETAEDMVRGSADELAGAPAHAATAAAEPATGSSRVGSVSAVELSDAEDSLMFYGVELSEGWFSDAQPDAAELSSASMTAAKAARKETALVQKSRRSPNTPLTPLLRWQVQVERRIRKALQAVSSAANYLLHRSTILPSQIPESLLEVASRADVTEMTSGTPNLLNLAIESAASEEGETALTRILAIRLRLSELEFADPSLGVWRSKLRGLKSRLTQLEREYEQKTTELAIAHAEQAWRAAWFED